MTIVLMLIAVSLFPVSEVTINPLFAQTSQGRRQLILEGFEFEGLSKTSPNVILNHMTIEPGDVLTPDVLELNQKRLAQTNFFKNVNLYTRPGSEKGRVVVIVKIKERKYPYFQFEGGRSDLDGFFFVPAGLRYDNAFGHGSRLALRWTIGDNISKLSLSYFNRFWGDRFFLDGELAAGGKNFIHYFDQGVSLMSEQTVDFGGLNLKIGGARGPFKYLFVAYRTQSYNPDDFVEDEDDNRITDLPASIADDLERTRIQAISLGFHADTRDNIAYPTAGFWGALTGELADKAFDSEASFSKLTLDARAFQKLFGRQVLALHLRGSYTTKAAPFYERFYLGGANSLRGYADRRLTPVGWGAKLVLAHSEFRFPLSERGFPFHKPTGLLFFDAGGIWQRARSRRWMICSPQ